MLHGKNDNYNAKGISFAGPFLQGEGRILNDRWGQGDGSRLLDLPGTIKKATYNRGCFVIY